MPWSDRVFSLLCSGIPTRTSLPEDERHGAELSGSAYPSGGHARLADIQPTPRHGNDPLQYEQEPSSQPKHVSRNCCMLLRLWVVVTQHICGDSN